MKSDRLLSIIIILTEKKMMSAPALAKLLEVSVRTIYRDVDTLSMAGIPIYTTTGKNGGIGILDSYKIDKQLLNINDVATLMKGLQSVRELIPKQHLHAVELKIKSLLDEGHKNQIEERLKELKIEHTANIKSIAFTERIQTAIQKHRVIEVTYRDRLGNQTERHIEPYRILIKDNEWYVQGFCLIKKDYRTFKLNRIANLTITDTMFTPREVSMEQFDEFHFPDNNLCLATFQIVESLVEKFITLYGEECIINKVSNDVFIAQIYIPMNEWGIRYILGYGEECICLGPDTLRKAIRIRLKRLLYRYE